MVRQLILHILYDMSELKHLVQKLSDRATYEEENVNLQNKLHDCNGQLKRIIVMFFSIMFFFTLIGVFVKLVMNWAVIMSQNSTGAWKLNIGYYPSSLMYSDLYEMRNAY